MNKKVQPQLATQLLDSSKVPLFFKRNDLTWSLSRDINFFFCLAMHVFLFVDVIWLELKNRVMRGGAIDVFLRTEPAGARYCALSPPGTAI